MLFKAAKEKFIAISTVVSLTPLVSSQRELEIASRFKKFQSQKMDFSEVLDKCGNYGRFQVVILLLYGYTNILGSLHYFSQTLITFTPEHW